MKKKNNMFLLIALCMMAASSIGLFMNSFGVFFTPIAESLHEKRGNVAMFSTILIFANALCGIFLPKIATNKNYKKIYIAGIAGTALSLIMMANAGGLMMLYVGSLFLGISMSTYFMVIITTIINSSFEKNIGTITGIVFSFSGLAGAVFSPMFAAVIEGRNWQTGLYVMAMLAVILCVPAVFADIRVESKNTDTPAAETVKFNYFTVAYICSLRMSFFYMFLPSIPQHLPGIASSKELNSSVGPLLVSSCMVGNIIFKLLAGILADKLGGLKTMLIMTVLNLTGSAMLLVGNSTFIALAGAFLYGSIYALTSVGVSYYTKEVFGIENYKKAYPLIMFSGNVSNALGISAVGYIYDFTASYNAAIILVMVLAAGGYILATVSRKKQRQTVQ